MSCSFISAFRDLSNLSCGAVANIDHFSELNKYLHVLRTPEEVLRDLLLRIEKVPQKRLVLVCGSAGDGKSHLLSYLRNEVHLLDDYMVYSDATESDAPNKTAISTLAKRLEAFNDENIANGGAEKIIIAINLGMLNNFIDSEEGESFTKLRQYVINNNITGDADALYKCLFELCENRHLTDDEYFPTAVKAHLDRGAILLQNEQKYAGNDFLTHLANLDSGL